MKYTLKEGGSGSGFSFWTNFLTGCPKKQELHNRFSDAGLSAPKEAELNIGTLVHAFVECWWQGVHPDDVEFEPTPNEEDYQKAFQLMKHFILRDPDQDLFGTPVHLEYKVPPDIVDDCDFNELQSYYKLHKPAQDLAKQLGFPGPWSGRIDAVTEIKENHVERLKKLYDLDLETGLYLVDHKTARSRPSTPLYYTGTIQFLSYILAWNTFYPNNPVKGMIANVVVKTVVPQFYAYFTPVPGEDLIKVVQAFYSQAYDRWQRYRGQPNPSQCVSFRPCYYLLAEECDRASPYVHIRRKEP